MSIRLRDVLMRELDTLRHEPIDKRIRGVLGDRTVVDSRRALLVWEPRRVVPSYAVPVQDVHAELAAATAVPPSEVHDVPLDGRPVLDPSIPFAVHTAEGAAVAIHAGGGAPDVAGFRPADPDLRDHVVVDFTGLDAWYEEDERNLGHPRDPFHRIDTVHSSRHVRVELAGEVLAESTVPCLLFEPPLPVRYYLPAEDVRTDLLRPSPRRTICAYKGEAAYWSTDGEDDVAWTYPHPQREAAEVTGRIAFFNERVDLIVDGERLERPLTPWSPRS